VVAATVEAVAGTVEFRPPCAFRGNLAR
jgi:hypothetical protein